MGLLGRIAELRKRHIVGIARSHIEGSEEVVCWGRARQPRGKRSGFLYVTPERLVVYWAGEAEGHASIRWKEVTAWGADTSVRGGPVMGVQAGAESVVIQMPARTNPSAASATEIIRAVAERVPRSAGSLDHDHHGPLEIPHPYVNVDKERRSIAGHTKRILVTVLGAVLVVGGVLITPIPGPWSFPIIVAGLAILASEYDIADDVLQWTKEKYRRAKQVVRSRRNRRSDP